MDVQKLIRCNEALRALMRLQQSIATGPSTCYCLSQLQCSDSDTDGRPVDSGAEKPTEKITTEQHAGSSEQHHDAQTSQQKDTIVYMMIRYHRLIEAIRLLKEDLDAEREQRKRMKKNQFRADVIRSVLFVAGMCAVIVLNPRC